MGATDFSIQRRGTSLVEAYQQAVEDAVSENGTDSYNGTISTTHGVIDKTNEFKASKLNINQFIEQNIDKCHKWGSAWGVCIEEPIQNKNKVKSKVNNIVEKGTKKWVLKFEVTRHGDTIKTCNTKGEAVTWGRTYVEKNKGKVSISMIKVLEKSNPKVAEIEYKPDNKEKQGSYVFFGMAAC
jgi:hypothetical protein